MNQMEYQNQSAFHHYQQQQHFFHAPHHFQPPPPPVASYPDPHGRFDSPVAAAAAGASPHLPQNQWDGAAGGFPLPPGTSICVGGSGGTSNVASAGSGGAMMQPGSLQHQHARVPQTPPYTTAPYSQPTSAPALTTAPQRPSQLVSSATPLRHISPYALPPNATHAAAAPTSQPQPPPHPMTSPAPSQSQAPASQATAQAAVKPPLSPAEQARERDRVTLLLEINGELIQEIVSLQAQGKGGAVGPPQQAPAGATGEQNKDAEPTIKMASKEYIDCLRRIQANLAYLAAAAERTTKPGHPVPPRPAIMAPPPAGGPPVLVELYKKLAVLFPGAGGAQARPSLSPTSSAGAGAGQIPTPTSATTTVVGGM